MADPTEVIWDTPPAQPQAPGVIWDRPPASPVQDLNGTQGKGFLGHVLDLFNRGFSMQAENLRAGGQYVRTQDPGPELSQPLVRFDPRLVAASNPFLWTLPQEVKQPIAEGQANVLSGATSPNSINAIMAGAIQPEVAAGVFAGLGAKQAGESAGQASVEAQTGQPKEAIQHGTEAVLSLLQSLPAFAGVRKTSPNEIPRPEPEATGNPAQDVLRPAQGRLPEAQSPVASSVHLEQEPSGQAVQTTESSLPAVPEQAVDRQRGVSGTPPPVPTGRGQSVPAELLPEGVGDTLREAKNVLFKQTVPRHSAVDEDLAGALMEYGNSQQAAKTLGESMATDALGSQRYRDPQFDRRVGDVLVEGMLRADGQTSIGKEWSSLKSEKDYLNALADPEIQRTIKIHKHTIQDLAEQMHTELGGSLADKDPVTGAFVNMKALFGEDTPLDQAGRSSRLTDPLQKGSKFNKERKGTADQYENSYRALAERMVRGNYDEAMKKRYFDLAEEKGYGKYLKAGEQAPEGSVVYTLKRKGVPRFDGEGEVTGANTYVKKFALRKDLADEFETAAQLSPEMRRSLTKEALKKATQLQTTLGVDAFVHAGQLISSVNSADRASGINAIGGLREMDTIRRLASNFMKVVAHDPRTQQEIAQFSRVSPQPDFAMRKGILGRMLNVADKTGRLALNEMYNEFVKKGMAEDSVVGRERFISAMGQYNKRLMTKLDVMSRDLGTGPFVTAGRSMNANALRNMFAMPRVEGVDAKTQARLVANRALGVATTIGVTVPMINYALNGNAFGPTGTPIGAIGWKDKSGELHIVDAAKWLLLRRPITGLSAVDRGIRGDKPAGQIASDAAFDVAKGMLHPYVGPGLNALSLGMTGHDVLGYKEADRPEEAGSRLKSAALALNPTVEALTNPKGKSVTETYLGAFGVKDAKINSTEKASAIAERLFNQKDVTKLNQQQRLEVAKQSKSEKQTADPVSQRKAKEFGTHKQLESVEDVQGALSKESQDFLKRNNLNLPPPSFRGGIKSEQKISGTYTPKEREYLQQAMVKYYEQGVQNLRNQGDFEAANDRSKQIRLQKQVDIAHKKAELELSKARLEGKVGR